MWCVIHIHNHSHTHAWLTMSYGFKLLKLLPPHRTASEETKLHTSLLISMRKSPTTNTT